MKELNRPGRRVAVSFLLTKEDYADAKLACSRSVYRPGEVGFLRWAGFFMVLLGLVLRVFFAPNRYSQVLYTTMVLLGVLIGFYLDNWQPLFVRWQAQRFYNTHGERMLAQSIVFDEETISITTDRYQAIIPYHYLWRVYEDGKVILFYTGQEEAWAVPKRALPPADLLKIRELLKQNENYKREGVR